jgi:beta-lactamase class A
MGLFFKKREDDYEEEVKADTKKVKDLKDLKPENKKKRKEPKKPWGKGERILVFLVLVLTAGASSLMGLSSRGWKLPGYPKIDIPKISWKKTYVFDEASGVGEVPELNASPAVEQFRGTTDELTGVYGFYVVRLSNGASYGYNHKQIFSADSLTQLPVMVMAYRGDVDLNDTHRLQEGDIVSGPGSLQNEELDTVWTFGELLKLMGKAGDVSAGSIVAKEIGEENVAQFLRTNGMSHTSLTENTTSPQDVGNLLLKLWNGDFVGMEARDELLATLTDTVYEEHLPAGIPEPIVVAHKYGRDINVVNDAGIAYTDEPFVVVIMSEGVKITEADEVFPELARLIWEFETSEAVGN